MCVCMYVCMYVCRTSGANYAGHTVQYGSGNILCLLLHI